MKFLKLFFLLSLFFSVNSCGEDTASEEKTIVDSSSSGIVGTWVLDDVTLGKMEDVPESQIEMMKGMMQMMKGKMKFTFNADGTTSVQSQIMGENINETGNYTAKNGVITIESPVKGAQEMDYGISNGKLTLASTEDGQEVTMVFIRE